MFSAKNAPFFHYGQNLSFPYLGPEFITHLAKKYTDITSKKINEKTLDIHFKVGKNFIIIRNPDEIKYDVIYVKDTYRIKNKDGVYGAKVGFISSDKGVMEGLIITVQGTPSGSYSGVNS